MPPLTLPVPAPSGAEPGLPLEDLAGTEAVRLFTERAQAARSDFALSPRRRSSSLRSAGVSTASRGDRVGRRLYPVPPPAALLARLEQRLPLLTGGPRDAPHRQRTMRDTVGWSYDLLNEAEQDLLRRLSVFAGGFGLAAAEAVCAADDDLGIDPWEGIATLVEHSLLRPEPERASQSGEPSEPRYEMLETVRDFAADRLGASGEAITRQAHAAYFLALAEEADNVPFGELVPWLDRLERDYDNLRAALAWLLASGDADGAVRLVGALVRFWFYRGHLSEGRRSTEQVLDATERDQAVAPRVRAYALIGCGLLASVQGDPARAIERLSEGLRLYEASNELRGQAVARGLLGGVLVSQGNYDEAAPLFAANLIQVRQLRDEVWTAHALFHLGAIAFGRGDHAAATPLLREAAERYDAGGGRLDAIDPQRYLGLIACGRGDAAGAAALLADNLARVREGGSPQAVATALADVATLAATVGSWAPAARLFAASEALRQAEGAALTLPARTVYEAAGTTVRRALGDSVYAAERAIGLALRWEIALTTAGEFLAAVPPLPTSPPSPAEAAGLTPREHDVLRLVAAGKSNPEIADALFIGRGTVHTHVSHILAKLGAASRTEAAAIAHRRGLV